MKRNLMALLIVLLAMTMSGCDKSNQPDLPDPPDQAEQKASSTETPMIENVLSIYPGNGYSMLIKKDHTLWSWGENSNFRLGTGKYGNATEPRPVMENVVDVALGEYTAYALKDDSTLWVWGSGFYSGLDIKEDIKVPMQLDTDVIKIKASDSLVMYQKKDMSIYVFGRSSIPLINGSEDIKKPMKLDIEAKDFWVSETNVFYLDSNDDLFGFGSDYSGELMGNAKETVETGTGFQYPFISTPMKLAENISTIQAPGGYVVALDKNGDLYTWGDNTVGQLGNGGLGEWHDRQYGGKYLSYPVKEKILSEIVSIASESGITGAIDKNGDLWMFGSNKFGKIGDGTTIHAAKPVKILANVKTVRVSRTHVFAILNNDEVMAWGSNANGEYGLGYATTLTEPIKIMENIKSASTYSNHTLVVTNDGKLYGFGDNEFGQLGDESFNPASSPKLIMEGVEQCAAGLSHSMSLLKNGDVMTWGTNGSGQIGNGNFDEILYGFKYRENGIPVLTDYAGNKIYVAQKNYHAPAVVMSDVKKIAAHWSTSYAIKNNGELYAFGWNESNQLGDDSQTSSALPKLVAKNIKNVFPHYGATTENDELLYWGYILKDGSRTPKVLLNNVKKIVFNNYDLILTTDGELKIAGYIPFHLSGDEEIKDENGLVTVAKGIKDFDANEESLFFIDNQNVLYAAEHNDIKLAKNRDDGISNILNGKNVYQVMDNVSDVEIGLNHVMIIDANGSLYSFGSNEFGELGNGMKSFTPVKITK